MRCKIWTQQALKRQLWIWNPGNKNNFDDGNAGTKRKVKSSFETCGTTKMSKVTLYPKTLLWIESASSEQLSPETVQPFNFISPSFQCKLPNADPNGKPRTDTKETLGSPT